MSRRTELAVGVSLIVFSSLAASACRPADDASGGATPPAAHSQPADSREASLRAYKNWKLVNPQPVRVARASGAGSAVVGRLCRDPVAGADDPHVDKFISVYVNDVGEHAMLAEETPHFPPGSVVVKEKRDTPGDGPPVLITVMVKRDGGYDAQKGDWEFLVMDGTAMKPTKPEQALNCWSCHANYQRTDFVTRRYLPQDVRAKLR